MKLFFFTGQFVLFSTLSEFGRNIRQNRHQCFENNTVYLFTSQWPHQDHMRNSYIQRRKIPVCFDSQFRQIQSRRSSIYFFTVPTRGCQMYGLLQRKCACGNHYTGDASSAQLDLTEKLPIPLGKVLVNEKKISRRQIQEV